jgi:hypothetical protein
MVSTFAATVAVDPTSGDQIVNGNVSLTFTNTFKSLIQPNPSLSIDDPGNVGGTNPVAYSGIAAAVAAAMMPESISSISNTTTYNYDGSVTNTITTTLSSGDSFSTITPVFIVSLPPLETLDTTPANPTTVDIDPPSDDSTANPSNSGDPSDPTTCSGDCGGGGGGGGGDTCSGDNCGQSDCDSSPDCDPDYDPCCC